MSHDVPADAVFAEFIQRIRAGDEAAAAELVRRYEPFIRRAVRVRLEGRRLRRLLDSTDLCQSVLASFFLRTASGQFELETPAQLVQLLEKMVRNKLASANRRQCRLRRDARRDESSGEVALQRVADRGPGPLETVANADLLRHIRESLTAEERQLAEMRSQGLSWIDIARQAGGSPHGRGMQLTRALDRILKAYIADD